MYTSSEVLIGIAVLLMCQMLVCVIFGFFIISILSSIRMTLVKFLRLYTGLHSDKQNKPQT